MEIFLGIWGKLPRGFSVLAPMEDVTDTVFRQIVREAGAPDLLMTEFTSTDGLCSEGRSRVVSRLRFVDNERPLVAQVWGTKPENFLRVAREVREMGFDGLDINMGCPVRKIIKGGACGALINNQGLAGELISAAREGAGGMPVSVKTRIGVTRPVPEEWLGFLLSRGISALTVHGRTVSQQSEGLADWGTVSLAVRLRDAAGVATRIIGNGDVRTPQAFPREVGRNGRGRDHDRTRDFREPVPLQGHSGRERRERWTRLRRRAHRALPPFPAGEGASFPPTPRLPSGDVGRARQLQRAEEVRQDIPARFFWREGPHRLRHAHRTDMPKLWMFWMPGSHRTKSPPEGRRRTVRVPTQKPSLLRVREESHAVGRNACHKRGHHEKQLSTALRSRRRTPRKKSVRSC